MQGLHPLDYIVVIGYFAIIVFIGFFFGMFIRQARDYFAAGAGVPAWMAGISLWMASFSAMTFVIYGQLSYRYGFLAITLSWVVAPAMIAAAVYLAPRWRRARIITPLGFIEDRYNANIRQLFVWTGIPLRTLDNALRIFSTAVFISFVVNKAWFPLETCIIAVGIIMILYTLLGGQWAILVTDFFQAFVLMIPVVILVPLALHAVGGLGEFVTKASAAQPGFFRPFTAGHGSYGVFDVIMFSVIGLISYNSSWGLVQKYNCVATEKDARKMAIIMCTLFCLTPFFFYIPTMVARVLMPELMDIPGGSSRAYAAICMKVLPVGTLGLMIAGMFAATLSTLGNEYNVLSGVLSKDFYAKVVNSRATDRQILTMGKINTVIMGLVTMGCAIIIGHIKVGNFFDVMNKVFGALAPAIYLPITGGLFLRWINSRGAVAGVLSGMTSGITLIILNIILKKNFGAEAADNPTLAYWLSQGYNSVSVIINVSVTLTAMWIGSSIGRVSRDEEARAAAFIERMDIPSVPPRGQSGKDATAIMIVGGSLMVFGVLFFPIGFMVGGQAMAINTMTGAVLMALGLTLLVLNAGRARQRSGQRLPAGVPSGRPRPRPRPQYGYSQYSQGGAPQPARRPYPSSSPQSPQRPMPRPRQLPPAPQQRPNQYSQRPGQYPPQRPGEYAPQPARRPYQSAPSQPQQRPMPRPNEYPPQRPYPSSPAQPQSQPRPIPRPQQGPGQQQRPNPYQSSRPGGYPPSQRPMSPPRPNPQQSRPHRPADEPLK